MDYGELQYSTIARLALSGIIVWTLCSPAAIAEARSGSVKFVAGTILEPSDLALGQEVAEGTEIQMGSDGVVVLSYFQRFRKQKLDCTLYVIISGRNYVSVDQELPKRCTGGASESEVLDRLRYWESFKAQVYFGERWSSGSDTDYNPGLADPSSSKQDRFLDDLRNVVENRKQ